MGYRNAILGRLGTALLAVFLLVFSPALWATTRHSSKPKKALVSSSRKGSSRTVAAKFNSTKHGRRSRHNRNWRHHGQQAVDGRRTEQIQQALIQSHYLDGEPSGAWDARTQEALRRYQAAHGWQSKVVPDSRALIKLGLGPSNDRLLNPESTITSHIDAAPSGATAPEVNTPRQ